MMLRNGLKEPLINSLLQISDILGVVQVLPEDKAVAFYQGSNAGKHVRHVLDHLLTFIVSVDTGILDYNRRNRESDIETNPQAAQAQLDDIVERIQALSISEKNVKVISEVDSCDTVNEHFSSNVPREILYLVNHTMHHAAYIKLLAKGQGIEFPDHIGIAPSTATHLRKLG